MTRFSIIVPIYNVECYLKDCIDSILGQTYKNFELILVDDGSTDGCSVFCDEVAVRDKRVKVVHKNNGGLVSARKAGVSIAVGEYALCVDSDDWVDVNYLSSLNDVINEYCPDIICFDYIEVTEDGMRENKYPLSEGLYSKDGFVENVYPSLLQNKIGKGFPPAIWAKAYKMCIYKPEQLEVDNGIKIGEDISCSIPCITKAESIYYLEKPLYFYRRNNISMTKNRKPFPWKGPDLIDEHLRDRISVTAFDMQQQISRRTVHALINVVKTQFYSNKKYRVLKAEIKKQLKRPVYHNALIDSKFKKGSLIELCRFFLAHDIIFPFYLLSKIR
ncbi:glycosyltransferase family 2 protein [uncultured Flavonifractor sp.]|uniref:glycosyltransferase family 2 protein n=1 Tax=uncultured Flavonifractor sp. TaxID=1193534 RepID=UPI00260C55B3|nr:glycosyltransferase family 2 protein [uncultured Flavonifractor sp.]